VIDQPLTRTLRRGATLGLALLALGLLAGCGGDGKDKVKFSPNADAAPFGGPVPLKVKFTASSGNIPGDVSYHWCFEDGTVSNEQNPTHVFARPGYYLVSVDIEGRKLTNRSTKNLYLGAWPPKLWARAQKGLGATSIKKNIKDQQRRTSQRRRDLRVEQRKTGKKSPEKLHPCGQLAKFGP
jgi:hypothetical protein